MRAEAGMVSLIGLVRNVHRMILRVGGFGWLRSAIVNRTGGSGFSGFNCIGLAGEGGSGLASNKRHSGSAAEKSKHCNFPQKAEPTVKEKSFTQC